MPGISQGDSHRAYPFEELDKQCESLSEDSFGGQRITVVWSDSANSAHVLDEDGIEMPTVIAYWFAWYAFHPETEVFRARN